MKDIFKTKNFKILIATLIIIIMCIGVSSVFDTSIISSAVGYITTGMQRVSATVVGGENKKSYEELYNSFTDEERKMTDEYYNKLFNENGVSLTDEEREAIQKGANLLKDFKHPEMYKLLEKYFPK